MSQHSFSSTSLTPDTWRTIDRLVDEVAGLAEQHGSLESFYGALLDRAVRALAADVGFVWVAGRELPLVSAWQIDRSAAENLLVVEQHARLAAAACARHEPTVLQLGQDAQCDGSFATHYALFCPVIHAGRIATVIEILLPPESTNQGRENSLQVLRAICELAPDFHHRLLIQRLERTDQQSKKFEEFTERLHQSLKLDMVAFRLANDGREISGCDRLSVLLVKGSGCRIRAVSGVDAIDRRSRQAQMLRALGKLAKLQGEPIWCFGKFEEMAPQLQEGLQNYLDVSHARYLGVLPLSVPRDDPDERGERSVFALIIGEDFDARRERDEFQWSLQHIARPATTALNNAVQYGSVPLLTTLAHLARMRWFFQAGRRGKTLLALGMLVVCIAALFLIPAKLTIQASGTIQPVIRRRLFAPDDGVVGKVLVKHAEQVAEGELLLKLAKPELELELIKVVGDLQTAQQLLQSIGAKRFVAGRDHDVSRPQKNQLAAEQERLKQQVENLAEQRKLLARRTSELEIHSPIKGTVLTWDMAQRLDGRPVTRGQQLLAVADLDGPWRLVLQVADRDIQHVLHARRDWKSALPVRYRLAMHPENTYDGRVAEVSVRSEVIEGARQTVRVIVEIDSTNHKVFRPGAEAVANINCGQRSIGYVWIREIWETIQLHVLF